MKKNYLKNRSKEIKKRHYILKTNLDNYFFNFRPNVLNKYKANHDEDFMMICWKDKEQLDAYFIPYSAVKNIFCRENITEQPKTKSQRWLGTITKHSLSLGNGKSLNVKKYYNCVESIEELSN